MASELSLTVYPSVIAVQKGQEGVRTETTSLGTRRNWNWVTVGGETNFCSKLTSGARSNFCAGDLEQESYLPWAPAHHL